MSPASAEAPTAFAALRVARALLAVSLLGAAAAVLVACTGGFRTEVGPWRFSMRSPWPALVLALLTAAIGFLLAPRALASHADAFRGCLARRAAAVALAVACATALTGVVHGSAVPSGADASGYLSQGALWRIGSLWLAEPAMLEAPWPEAAWTFSPLGYRPARTPGALVPTYPPGLPIHFAVAGALAGDIGLRAVVPLLGALGVWCAFVLARRLAGPVAGIAAASLLATSPPWLSQLLQPMSDVPVTAWWLACLAVASRPAPASPSRAAIAGAIAGVAWLVRPNLVLLLPVALWLLLPRRRDPAATSSWPLAAAFGAGLSPAIALLCVVNWALYGAPWTSGYGRAADLFSLSFVGRNIGLYGGWLSDVHLPLLLVAALGGAVSLVTRERPRVPRLWPALVLLGLAVCASYLVYAPFETWAYLRFLLPAIAVLAVAAGMAVAALARVQRPWAPAAALLVLVAMAGLAWDQARQLDVFSTAQRERRYLLAAQWVQRHAPPGTRWLASQHSGSLRATTGRPVIRWDLLEPGRRADTGQAWLDLAWTGTYAPTAGDREAAWLVVDAEEEPAFRRRFASVSDLGRLDWPPSAATAPPAPVRVYRLEDRERYVAGQLVQTAQIGDSHAH